MSLTSYQDTETPGTPLTLAKEDGGQLYVPDHFTSGNRAL